MTDRVRPIVAKCFPSQIAGRFARGSSSSTGLTRFFRSASPIPAVAGLSLMLGAVPSARAQADPSAPTQQLPTPSPPTTQGGDIQSRRADAPQASASESQKFNALNKLVLKGWATTVPTYGDTIDRDTGGWRDKLAQVGVGFTIWSLNLGVYDFARAGSGISGAQLYNGQRFTYQTGNQTAVLTYDLGHLAERLHGGQWAAIVAGSANSYQTRDGIRGIRVKGFSWYQPVASGRAELEGGIIANQTDYLGTSVGGSLAGGALGPQASLPVEAGLSYGQYGAPTLSARINWTHRFYTRTGLQRSITPQGSTTENEYNPTGFTFTTPGARPLIMQEFGYRIVAERGIKSFWFRTGGLFNDSKYTSVVDKSPHDNHFVYAAVDRQLTQPGVERPARGLYVGATYNAGPGNIDLISRYYEARAYERGLLATRPDDMLSVVAAISGYGEDGRKANTIADFTPFATTQSYTGSYSFRITHGFYIQPGLSVVVHPVYNRNIGTAVNGLLNLVGFF